MCNKFNKLQKDAAVYFDDIMHLLSVETWGEALPHIRMEVETSEPSTQYVNTVVEELKENSQDPDEAFRQAAQRFWSAGQNSTITRINSVGYSYISRNENKQLVLFSVFIDIDLALFSLYWGPIKASSTGATSFAVLQSWETIKAPMSIDDLDTWLPDLPIFGFLGELYHNMKYKKGKKE